MKILVVCNSSREENKVIDFLKSSGNLSESYSFHDMKKILTSSNISLYNVFNNSCLDVIVVIGDMCYSDNIYITEIIDKNKRIKKLCFPLGSNILYIERKLNEENTV